MIALNIGIAATIVCWVGFATSSDTFSLVVAIVATVLCIANAAVYRARIRRIQSQSQFEVRNDT